MSRKFRSWLIALAWLQFATDFAFAVTPDEAKKDGAAAATLQGAKIE